MNRLKIIPLNLKMGVSNLLSCLHPFLNFWRKIQFTGVFRCVRILIVPINLQPAVFCGGILRLFCAAFLP